MVAFMSYRATVRKTVRALNLEDANLRKLLEKSND
jgi:aminoglycoside phosphotransferase family enzyme